MKIISYGKYVLRDLFYLRRERKKLKNKDFSIVSSNCLGGLIAHDFKCGFNSPFVNLWIEPQDFIILLKKFKYFMNSELSFIQLSNYAYPVGLLGDAIKIKIYFMHYETKEAAADAWERRKRRINYDNLFVIFTDRDGCTRENLEEFEQLSYNKVCFTHVEYPDLKSCFYIPGFENNGEVGMLMKNRGKSFKRYYDDFSFADWFNGKMR